MTVEKMLAHANGLAPDGPPVHKPWRDAWERRMSVLRAEAAHIRKVCDENRAAAARAAEERAEAESLRRKLKLLFAGGAITETRPMGPRGGFLARLYHRFTLGDLV